MTVKTVNRIFESRLRCLISFVLLFALCLLFPYTGDDWAWGTAIGLERLASRFDRYNGRYLANLIVLALTRSRPLCAAVTAAVMVGISALISAITERPWTYELSALALFTIPKAIGAQTIVFASGFVNYTLSVCLLLLYMACVFRARAARPGWAPGRCLFMLLLGFAGCLFVEHVSICTAVLSLGVLLNVRGTERRWDLPRLSHLCGAVAGCVLMFSNSAYRMVADRTDTYRSFADGGLLMRALRNYLSVIYREGCLNNGLLNMAIFLVCLLCVFFLRERITSRLARVCLAFQGVFSAYSLFAVMYMTDARRGHFLHAEGLFSFLGLLSMFGTLLFISSALEDKRIRDKLIFAMTAILLSLAPLLLVTPLTSRCFMAAYVFYILLLCLAADMCARAAALRWENPGASREGASERHALRNGLKSFLLLGIACMYILYMGMYYSIHKTDVNRLMHIRADVAAGRQETEILHFPYESFLWTAMPVDVWDAMYKLFYDLPEDLTLIPVWEYTEDLA